VEESHVNRYLCRSILWFIPAVLPVMHIYFIHLLYFGGISGRLDNSLPAKSRENCSNDKTLQNFYLDMVSLSELRPKLIINLNPFLPICHQKKKFRICDNYITYLHYNFNT
jgi:hypothetical protein